MSTHDLDDANKQEGKRKWYFSVRINMFFLVTFLLFSVLIVSLAYLQFVQGPVLQAQKALYEKKPYIIPPVRGNIYDMSGAPIAWTVSTQTLFYTILPTSKDQSSTDRWKEQVNIANNLAEVFAKYSDKPEQKLTAQEIFELMDTEKTYTGEKRTVKGFGYWPRRIRSDLNEKEIAYISEHRDEFPGMDISEETVRTYEPDDSKQVAAQMVGYMKPFKGAITMDDKVGGFYKSKQEDSKKDLTDFKNNYQSEEYVGIDGLEFMYQDELRGENGKKEYPVNAKNEIRGEPEITYPEKGHNLYLTLNKNVQLAAQNAITEHLAKLQSSTSKYWVDGKEAVAGYAVAMEVDTGRIVAMASMPDYNPSSWYNLTSSKLREILNRYPNGTIKERYADLPDDKVGKHPSSLVPLGSTIKPLTILVGLQEKLITPWSTYADSGTFLYGKDNSKIRNSEGHSYGLLTPATAIEHSSNTFMAAMIGDKLYKRPNTDSAAVWDSYMKQFGLGVSTESGLPYESKGIADYLNPKAGTAQTRMVMSSFGQMGKYTTLQLAQYVSMLANHGKRMKPLFVDRITTADNQVLSTWRDNVTVLNEVEFPDSYWKVLYDGMESGIEGFENFPYAVKRKTGTSESSIAGKTIENAVFISYAPADKPKLAIAVVVPEGGYGRYGAAPIARKIYDAYDEYIGLTGTPRPKTESTDTTGTTGTDGKVTANGTTGTGQAATGDTKQNGNSSGTGTQKGNTQKDNQKPSDKPKNNGTANSNGNQKKDEAIPAGQTAGTGGNAGGQPDQTGGDQPAAGDAGTPAGGN
ncbi:peptidoglycan D,D-transpeptidase FtsI family protein [Gorillibacterium massiliense]|uniref:peptidoglycan D,D-transpeptidase FtsI family protein n=1 Tax=Gorillibacterium massiliense TaxID=1280390 RepID=UPI0004AEBC06|nr:penicillin-binding transpeptidase domain-containing protein [Gorillibacterium massiliense]